MTINQVREGLAVAAAEGVNIPAEEADHILQKVIVVNLSIGQIISLVDKCVKLRKLKVIASRQENKTSMCVDVLKKRFPSCG